MNAEMKYHINVKVEEQLICQFNLFSMSQQVSKRVIQLCLILAFVGSCFVVFDLLLGVLFVSCLFFPLVDPLRGIWPLEL